MITREEYVADPAALHEAYYREIAEEAELPHGVPERRLHNAARLYRKEITEALERRGSPWSIGYAINALMEAPKP